LNSKLLCQLMFLIVSQLIKLSPFPSLRGGPVPVILFFTLTFRIINLEIYWTTYYTPLTSHNWSKSCWKRVPHSIETLLYAVTPHTPLPCPPPRAVKFPAPTHVTKCTPASLFLLQKNRMFFSCVMSFRSKKRKNSDSSSPRPTTRLVNFPTK